MFPLVRKWMSITAARKQFRKIHTRKRPEAKPAAVAYMESRGISEAVTRRYNITVRNDNEKILVFPFYDENEILHFVKYRNTGFVRALIKTRNGVKRTASRSCLE